MASSVPCVFLPPVGFVLYFNIRYFAFISSISTVCQIVTLLQSLNVVCPEIRVKGPSPIDSFRFLAFILLL